MAALAAAMLAEPSAAPPEHPAPAWLTIREVAERLKLAPSYVYQLARRGDLPHVKRGKYVRVPADALAEWAARLERNGLNGSRMRHDVLAAPLRRKVARPSRLAA
jgi:excisionase family DNA binding protein